jgi:hypothetical protein
LHLSLAPEASREMGGMENWLPLQAAKGNHLAVLCYAVKQLISKVSDAGFDSLVRHVTTLNCFKCGKKLEPIIRNSEYNQPYAGTTFVSYGHYGSTVFDPRPSLGSCTKFLELNICDDCLRQHRDQLVYCLKLEQPAKYEYSPWDPEADD